MKIEGDYLIFSKRRSFYANGGIVGLDPDLEITYGYDRGFRPIQDDAGSPVDEYTMTKAEAVELADYMIEQWKAFREKWAKEVVV